MAELKGYLTLIGDNFDLDFVSQTLKMKPDSIRKKDDLLPNGRQFGHVEWGIQTQTQTGDNVEPILQQLMDRTKGKTSVMREIAEDCHAIWNVLILLRVYDELPLIIFSPDTIKYLYEIQAKLGFDTYLLLGED